ncbi:MAG: sigma-54-dependent Fis family transcriptional regulator [Deltaproteobacteria bacterium]|nr:sigma-54-dependent Fis family transcriptional regulator [Deltaproteobacteria bacterium]
MSRKAIRLQREPGGGALIDNPALVDVTIDGVATGEVARLTAERLQQGVVLVLGCRVVLVLHRAPAALVTEELGMIGASAALHELRRAIRALARGATASGAVLLRAETGSGKELAARALHAQGPRRAAPFVAVNLAAIPASTAAAELFGHARGAFTGATDARAGFVGQAEGGTLFLDEIGEASLEVQAMLLRALDQREEQPVGGIVRRADVFIVAATDAPLERLVAEGRFREALLHRLQGAQLSIPPLRERREDAGTLFYAFLDEAMGRTGVVLEDQSLEKHPWPSAALLAAIALHPWPGNVRQLRNFAAHCALQRSLGREVGPADLPGAGHPGTPAQQRPAPVIPGHVDDEALLAALCAHRFQLNATAKALGMTRVKLDQRIEAHPAIRKAKDLSKDEIAAARESAGGDLDETAARLEVSVRGLKLRMTQLGM